MWDESDILADPHLVYYYNFDGLDLFPTDSAHTSDFVLDQSGKPGDRNLQAVNKHYSGSVWIGSASDLSLYLPTTFGNSMQFNLLQFQWNVWGWQLGLIAQHDFPIEHEGFRGAGAADLPIGTGSTFVAQLAYIPFDLIADPPFIVPYDPPGPVMPVISTASRPFGAGQAFGANLGFRPLSEDVYGVGIMYYEVGGSTGAPGFSWESPEAFGANEWVQFVSSIEKTGQVGTTPYFRRRIWLNGELVTELEGDRSTTGATYEQQTRLSFGTSHYDDIREGHGKGMVDSVAYFSYAPARESWGIIAQ